MIAAAGLQDELVGVVTAVPGVTVAYPAQPLPAAVVGSLVSLAVDRGPQSPIVLGEDPDGLTVAVTIGVDASGSAAAICRDVYSAIVRHLAGAGMLPAHSVRVLVGTIG
jgi:hypothetical protein